MPQHEKFCKNLHVVDDACRNKNSELNVSTDSIKRENANISPMHETACSSRSHCLNCNDVIVSRSHSNSARSENRSMLIRHRSSKIFRDKNFKKCKFEVNDSWEKNVPLNSTMYREKSINVLIRPANDTAETINTSSNPNIHCTPTSNCSLDPNDSNSCIKRRTAVVTSEQQRDKNLETKPANCACYCKRKNNVSFSSIDAKLQNSCQPIKSSTLQLPCVNANRKPKGKACEKHSSDNDIITGFAAKNEHAETKHLVISETQASKQRENIISTKTYRKCKSFHQSKQPYQKETISSQRLVPFATFFLM